MNGKNEGPEKILVVDDDELCRRALQRGLTRLGYEVLLAADGEEGYRLAVETQPNLILTDLRMPQMDGHTLLRRLAANKLDSAVVVMSAHGNMDDVVDALRNGAIDYLKKPWTPTELVSAVGRGMEAYQHRIQVRDPGQPAVANPAVSGPAVSSPATAPPSAGKGAYDPAFARILDELRRGEITVPAVPAVVGQLRSLVQSEDVNVEKVAALISRDQRLTAQVLRISNSAHFARSGKSNDIRTAVSRIGFRQIQAMVETAFANACWQAKRPDLRKLQQGIWQYSVLRAVSMRALADLRPAGETLDPQTAYVAGLLADVGASFLLWMDGERERPNGGAAVAAPLESIRPIHQEVGVAVLAKWEVAPEVLLVAGAHHEEAPPEPNPYWSLSIVASVLADSLGSVQDVTREAPPQQSLVDRCAAELQVAPAVLDRLRLSLKPEVASLLEAFA